MPKLTNILTVEEISQPHILVYTSYPPTYWWEQKEQFTAILDYVEFSTTLVFKTCLSWVRPSLNSKRNRKKKGQNQ